MNVRFSKERADWLEQLIVSGRFSSMDEALDAAVNSLQADLTMDDDWAKPLVLEALHALDRGEAEPWSKGEAVATLHAKHAGLVDDKGR